MALSSVRQGCKVLMRSDAVVLPNCLATMACRMFVPAWALDHGLDPQRGLRKAGIVVRVGLMQRESHGI